MMKLTFFIDKTKFETSEQSLTVRQILENYAKVDLARNTLALKEHGNFKELKNLEESIALKNGMHFTIFNEDPTTVS